MTCSAGEKTRSGLLELASGQSVGAMLSPIRSAESSTVQASKKMGGNAKSRRKFRLTKALTERRTLPSLRCV